jgi:hypothetical protein
MGCSWSIPQVPVITWGFWSRKKEGSNMSLIASVLPLYRIHLFKIHVDFSVIILYVNVILHHGLNLLCQAYRVQMVMYRYPLPMSDQKKFTAAMIHRALVPSDNIFRHILSSTKGNNSLITRIMRIIKIGIIWILHCPVDMSKKYSLPEESMEICK